MHRYFKPRVLTPQIWIGIGCCLLILTNDVLAKPKWAREGDPQPTTVSTDATYAVTEKNPVRVGGGARAELVYLSSLRGPHGEALHYERQGSCCFFKTPNAWVGDEALLDRYEVTYDGLAKPMIVFIDMYDREQPLVPLGLTKAR